MRPGSIDLPGQINDSLKRSIQRLTEMPGCATIIV
jgi:hypothetical protein